MGTADCSSTRAAEVSMDIAVVLEFAPAADTVGCGPETGG